MRVVIIVDHNFKIKQYAIFNLRFDNPLGSSINSQLPNYKQ